MARLTTVVAGLPAVCLLGLGVAAGPVAADPTTPVPPAPVNAEHSPDPAGPGPGPGPLSIIDRDGLYAVGTQILPGLYGSAGPAEGTKCYWKRVAADGSILDNALTAQPQIVQIEPTDAAFKTRGCQPWQLTDGVAPPGQAPPWLSQLQLRHQLDILNGLAGRSGNGQLPPY